MTGDYSAQAMVGVLEEYEESWICPYCGKDYGTHPDPHPNAIACCDEVGHLMQRKNVECDPDDPYANDNGHRYGCECDECMDFYRSLK